MARASAFGEFVDHVAFGEVEHVLHALAFFFAVDVFERVGVFQAALAGNDVDRIVFHAVEGLAASELIACHGVGAFFQLWYFAVEAYAAADPCLCHFHRAGE